MNITITIIAIITLDWLIIPIIIIIFTCNNNYL